MAENMCRTSEVTEIVPPGIGAVVLKELPAAGKEGIVYVIDSDPVAAYTWDGEKFVSMGGNNIEPCELLSQFMAVLEAGKEDLASVTPFEPDGCQATSYDLSNPNFHESGNLLPLTVFVKLEATGEYSADINYWYDHYRIIAQFENNGGEVTIGEHPSMMDNLTDELITCE